MLGPLADPEPPVANRHGAPVELHEFPSPGAAVAFLLSEDARGISGRLISAPWDPWREPEFQARLRSERDLATIRRIDEQFFTTA